MKVLYAYFHWALLVLSTYVTNEDIVIIDEYLKNQEFLSFFAMKDPIISQHWFGKIKALASTVVLFALALTSNGQVLNGTYTVGGTSPDYQTVTDAIDALKTEGIGSNVTFNLRSGSYDEQILIPEITGSSANAVITFQSETGNKDDVLLHHAHTNWSTTSNYTVFIDGADNLVFRNLTIQADPENLGDDDQNRVLYIQNDANNLLFQSNNFNSWHDVDDYFEYNDCIFVGADYNQNKYNDSVSFIGNTIYGGSIGLNFEGSASAGDFVAGTWLIEDNTFLEQNAGGLQIRIGVDVTVRGNKFLATKELPYFKSIYLDQISKRLIVEKNEVQQHYGGTGIEISNIDHSSSAVMQLVNNSVVLGPHYTTGTPIGIKSQRNDSLLVAHNAVNLTFDVDNGYVFQTGGSDTVAVYNNQFVHKGGGIAFYSTGNTQGSLTSNHNNIYTTGSLARIEASEYTTLSQLQSATSQESSSFAVDPLFVNDYVLIPYEPTINDQGTAVASVTDDYYGNARSVTSPDIGLFEGGVSANDVGIVSSSLDEYIPCPGDLVPVEVTIKNYGTNPLSSVNISYNDGINATVVENWTGNLAAGAQMLVYLGDITVTGSEVEVTMWSGSPNTAVDEIPYNDTLVYSKMTAMKGDYIVGTGVGSDFTTLVESIAALEQLGVCGATRLLFEDGTYQEQVIIHEIEGASETNRITLTSQSGDSSLVNFTYYTGSSGNFVLYFNGAKYFNVENLTINPLGSSNQIGVLARFGANHLNFNNNVILGSSTNSNSYKILMHFADGNADTITVRNNRIENGGTQLYFSGNNSNHCNNIVIENNHFTGSGGQAMILNYVDDLIIRGNTIDGARSSGGVDLEDCTSPLIEKNKLDLSANGILMVDLEDCIGTLADPIMFKNNFLIGRASNYAIGLDADRCSHLKVLNNSFYIVDNDGAGFQFGNTMTDLEVYNNIFNVYDEGRYMVSYYEVDPTFKSDHNGFYSSGTASMRFDNVHYSIREWREQFGLDINSIYTDPQFLSDSNLHITHAMALNGVGTPLTSVMDDIDGEARDPVNPDIGADEFDVDMSTFHDIELIKIVSPDTTACVFKDSVIIRVKNNSIFPITSLTAKWWMYGNLRDSLYFDVAIAPQATADINLGPYSFVKNTAYQMDFQIDFPNGNTDNFFNNNDNKLISAHQIEDVTIYQKEEYRCEADKQLYIKNFPRESALWSTGSSENKIAVASGGLYSVTVTHQNGCEVSDSIDIQ